jgi:hypothetical protein
MYFKVWKNGYYGENAKLEKVYLLNKNMTTWKQWIQKNKFKFE